jgi:hypothetical protein
MSFSFLGYRFQSRFREKKYENKNSFSVYRSFLTVFTLHYRNRVLCRVSKTLGKDYFTLGKAFAECYTRQRTLGKNFIGKGFFAECFFSDTRQRLCRVSKSTRQIKTLDKLNIEKIKKNSKTFFLNSRNNSPILYITLSIALSFFIIILNQI